MKITIEFDGSNSDDMERLSRVMSLGDAAPSKPAKAAKPAVKPGSEVTGNPDQEPAKPAAAATPEPAAVDPETVTLPEGTAQEIVRIAGGDHSKDAVSKAILKCSKDKGRAIAVGILESFRPEGNTDELIKVSAIAPDNYPKLAAAILAAYTS